MIYVEVSVCLTCCFFCGCCGACGVCLSLHLQVSTCAWKRDLHMVVRFKIILDLVTATRIKSYSSGFFVAAAISAQSVTPVVRLPTLPIWCPRKPSKKNR